MIKKRNLLSKGLTLYYLLLPIALLVRNIG